MKEINLHNYKFIFQNRDDFSNVLLSSYFGAKWIDFAVQQNPKFVLKEWIPVGTVSWIQQILGKKITPNYYPDFLRQYLHRSIWKCQRLDYPNKTAIFIKPFDEYKRFDGQIYPISDSLEDIKELGPYWCSEIVDFVDEWRYYVIEGEVWAAEWYKGKNDMSSPAPELGIDWPKDFTGVTDFGRLSDGKIALIENHAPFSCGWYSKDQELHAKFLVKGWEYMLDKYAR